MGRNNCRPQEKHHKLAASVESVASRTVIMASTSKALSRAALILSRRPPPGRPQVFNSQIALIGRQQQTRFFYPSPLSYDRKKDSDEPKDISPMDLEQIPDYSIKDFTKAEKTMYELMSPEEQALFDAENKRFVDMWNDPAQRQRDSALIEEGAKQVDRESQMRFEDVKDRGRGIWANEEDDEFAQTEDGDDVFHDDEMTSMAHAELELHREVREFARIAAWDMPLLSSMSCKLFELRGKTRALINRDIQN
jgi:small subunit ribosomal protein S35